MLVEIITVIFIILYYHIFTADSITFCANKGDYSFSHRKLILYFLHKRYPQIYRRCQKYIRCICLFRRMFCIEFAVRYLWWKSAVCTKYAVYFVQCAYISADTIVENVKFGIILLTLYSYRGTIRKKDVLSFRCNYLNYYFQKGQ